jgi:hypothetical protein
MATIGTFTRSGDSCTGTVKTLSINAKATIKPAVPAILTLRARRELAKALKRIGEDNPDAAERLYTGVQEAARRIGRPTPLRPPERSLSATRHARQRWPTLRWPSEVRRPGRGHVRGPDGRRLFFGHVSPCCRAQVSSGMSKLASAGSGWRCMSRTKGPSAVTTPRAPMATAKATYRVSYVE